MNRNSAYLVFAVISISQLAITACKFSQDSSLSLVNGALDTDKFPAVIQTAVKEVIATSVGQATGTAIAKCTASIISKTVVLTAAHCLTRRNQSPLNPLPPTFDPFQPNLDPKFNGKGPLIEQLAETLADNASVIINGVEVTGGVPYIHDRYLSQGPDVGVVVFKDETALEKAFAGKPITKDGQSVTFEQIIMRVAGQDNKGAADPRGISLADGSEGANGSSNQQAVGTPDSSNTPNSGTGDLSVGTPVTIVGFGKTNQFDENSGGEKRYGTNKLTKIGNTLDFTGQTTSTTADGTNVFNSQGDSGGPMMSAAGKYAGAIIGVSSTQNTVEQGDTTGEGHYTNLTEPSVAEFITKHLAGFSGGNNSHIPNPNEFSNNAVANNNRGSQNAGSNEGVGSSGNSQQQPLFRNGNNNNNQCVCKN